MSLQSSEGGTPFFSVVIPTHRRPDLLAQALDSVAAQSFSDLEVIVVDDDLQGHSARAVVEDAMRRHERLAIAYMLNDHAKGGSGARNAGIDHARGTWVAFLDDDDTWLPDKLAEVNTLIVGSADPDLVLVYSANAKYDFDTGRVVSQSKPEARGSVLDRVLYENCVGGMSVVVARRDALHRIGGLDERFLALQDMELYVRLAEIGTFDFVPQPLVRIRSSNRERITVDPRKKLQGAQLFARKYGDLLGGNARLKHRAASRTFVFAVAARNYGAALKNLPWTTLGVIVDPGNLIYVMKSLGRQLRTRRPHHASAVPASSR